MLALIWRYNADKSILGVILKRILIVGLCLATCFLAFSAQSAVDPQSELSSIIDQFLRPAAQKATDAIPLVTTDPARACQLETEAMSDIEEAHNRVLALEQQLKTEGRDVAPILPLKNKLEQAMPAFLDNKKNTCSGSMSHLQDDPVMGEMTQKIGAYMRAFSNDLQAADMATQKNDKKTYCQSLLDGRTQLTDLNNYLTDWLKGHSLSPQDAAAMGDFANKVADFQTKNDTKLKQCPAT